MAPSAASNSAREIGSFGRIRWAGTLRFGHTLDARLLGQVHGHDVVLVCPVRLDRAVGHDRLPAGAADSPALGMDPIEPGDVVGPHDAYSMAVTAAWSRFRVVRV